ncbi:MAG: ATP-binding cassette domain-containing protein, partial [Rhodospirillales bacterium]|nr:ATP-binding cassette domain-containing protein [Rhodospirillales bacterium]
MTDARPVLDVKDLSMHFGGLRAVDHVNLDIRADEIVALIGPNGAGKTTVFNCITGLYVPTGGEVFLSGRDGGQKKLNGLKPNRVTELG